ncbi:MAG: aspartate/glutamate racemase family protein [Candidatus Bathyarchaeia archaeon]
MKRVIGILGGMGPEATADLFHRIIRATPADKDQDHFRTIIDSNPAVPDRTEAILHEGADPVPEMLKSGKTLQGTGVDFIVIPCNSAHYFHNRLSAKLDVPILHMIDLTAERASSDYHGVEKAGLLATDGTVQSGIYHKRFEQKGIHIITPESKEQDDVMEAIYEYIKKGNLEVGGRILKRIAEELEARGSDVIICGCTEVSLVLHDGDLEKPVLDPLQILAETAVEVAAGEREPE